MHANAHYWTGRYDRALELVSAAKGDVVEAVDDVRRAARVLGDEAGVDRPGQPHELGVRPRQRGGGEGVLPRPELRAGAGGRSSRERAMVSRNRWAPCPAASAYSPRSPVSSGQPRPRVSREPGSTGSHWLPSRFSPYPSKLERCQKGPLAVP